MCRQPVRMGVPLNEETFSRMDEIEREFWQNFLQDAADAIDLAKEMGEAVPYDPPESLAEKYHTALAVYDGEKYCQIRQLQRLFDF